jgi:hypothetical protein
MPLPRLALLTVAALATLPTLVAGAGCRDREADLRAREATKKALAELEAKLAAQAARQPKAKPVPTGAEPASAAAIDESAAPGASAEASPAPPGAKVNGAGKAHPPAGGTGATQVTEAHGVTTSADFVVDDAVTVGPPGPATATSLGAVLFSREAELAVASLATPGRLTTGKTPQKTPIHALAEGSGPFALGFGPGVFQDHAYWVSQGRLVRRKLRAREAPGPLEVLATDANDGTRVAVPLPKPDVPATKIPATVAYVRKPKKEDDPLLATLWVEGAAPEGLTAEGNSTHSVSLVRTDDGVMALSVQARMAMTPVHARPIRFVSGKPQLGDDLVVWVGGGITPLTEMAVLPGTGKNLWGFIPHERSISEFGLARLDITTAPTMDTPISWLLYANGIDPAPVAAANVCGFPVVVYAAPANKAPDARQDLLLRKVSAGGAGGPHLEGEPPLAVGESRVFYFVSIAPVENGALVVWVTDGATRAATVRCTTARK